MIHPTHEATSFRALTFINIQAHDNFRHLKTYASLVSLLDIYLTRHYQALLLEHSSTQQKYLLLLRTKQWNESQALKLSHYPKHSTCSAKAQSFNPVYLPGLSHHQIIVLINVTCETAANMFIRRVCGLNNKHNAGSKTIRNCRRN